MSKNSSMRLKKKKIGRNFILIFRECRFQWRQKFDELLLNCIEISISETKEKSRLKGRCQI